MWAKNLSPELSNFFPSKKKDTEEKKILPSVFNDDWKKILNSVPQLDDVEITFSSTESKEPISKLPANLQGFFPEKTQAAVNKNAWKALATAKANTETGKLQGEVLNTNTDTTKTTSPVDKPSYESAIFWDKISKILDISDIDKLNTKQLLNRINTTKIWLDINSPKEWDKWIKKNEKNLSFWFKESFAEKFPDLYSDIDASIVSIPWDINSSIQNEAKRLYEQKKWPYVINWNSISDDLIFDIPLTRLWTKELMSSIKAQWWDLIPWLETSKWIMKYNSQEEALKELIILQEAIKDASDWIHWVILEFFSMIWDWFMELKQDMDNNDAWEFTKDLIIDAFLILIHTSVWLTVYRKINTLLIKTTSWSLKLPFIKGWDLEKVWSWWATTESAAKEKWLMQERDTIIRKLRYIYTWNQSKLNQVNGTWILNKLVNTLTLWQSLDGLRRVSDSKVQDSKISWKALEPSFNRKVTNINASWIRKLWNNSLADTLIKVLLIRTNPDSFMERWVETKNNVLKVLFDNLKIEIVEISEGNKFEKIDARNAQLKGEFKTLLDSVFLSHAVLNSDEKKIKEAIKKYIQELKDWKIANIESLNSKKILNDIKKELLNRIKDGWVKIDKNFIEKSKHLEDAKKTLFNDIKKGETIQELVEREFKSRSDLVKAELHWFYTEVHTGSEKYDIRTAIDIIARIDQWKTSEQATKESFKVDVNLIESIEKRPTTKLMLSSLQERISKWEYKLQDLKNNSKKGFVKATTYLGVWIVKKWVKATKRKLKSTTKPSTTNTTTQNPTNTQPITSAPKPVVQTAPVVNNNPQTTVNKPNISSTPVEISELSKLKNIVEVNANNNILKVFVKWKGQMYMEISIDSQTKNFNKQLKAIERIWSGSLKTLSRDPRGGSTLSDIKKMGGVSFGKILTSVEYNTLWWASHIETKAAESTVQWKSSLEIESQVRGSSTKAAKKSKTQETKWKNTKI